MSENRVFSRDADGVLRFGSHVVQPDDLSVVEFDESSGKSVRVAQRFIIAKTGQVIDIPVRKAESA